MANALRLFPGRSRGAGFFGWPEVITGIFRHKQIDVSPKQQQRNGSKAHTAISFLLRFFQRAFQIQIPLLAVQIGNAHAGIRKFYPKLRFRIYKVKRRELAQIASRFKQLRIYLQNIAVFQVNKAHCAPGAYYLGCIRS